MRTPSRAHEFKIAKNAPPPARAVTGALPAPLSFFSIPFSSARMTAISPLRWPAEALWQAIDPILPGFTVEVLPQIDSTSSELMRRARAGLAAPTLLVAEEQTAGCAMYSTKIM